MFALHLHHHSNMTTPSPIPQNRPTPRPNINIASYDPTHLHADNALLLARYKSATTKSPLLSQSETARKHLIDRAKLDLHQLLSLPQSERINTLLEVSHSFRPSDRAIDRGREGNCCLKDIERLDTTLLYPIPPYLALHHEAVLAGSVVSDGRRDGVQQQQSDRMGNVHATNVSNGVLASQMQASRLCTPVNQGYAGSQAQAQQNQAQQSQRPFSHGYPGSQVQGQPRPLALLPAFDPKHAAQQHAQHTGPLMSSLKNINAVNQTHQGTIANATKETGAKKRGPAHLAAPAAQSKKAKVDA